jgi:hypothetical protein
MRTDPGPRRQRGAALLLMMLAVLVSITTVLVTRLDLNKLRSRQLADTQAVLAVAREALLDYATLRQDLAAGAPAMLPCPDIDDSGGFLEGEAHDGACGAAGVTVMGRLPWRTLGIPPLSDAASACLWYVVSGSYKDAGAAAPLLVNPDTNGQLTVTSVETGSVIASSVPAERPAALIIAPMAIAGGQLRAAATSGQCSPGFDAAEFLETDGGTGISNSALSGVADGIDPFAVVAGHEPVHNDRMLAVTRADIARRVLGRRDFDARVGELGLAVAECLVDYARNDPDSPDNSRFPWPAPVAMADYRPDGAYDDLAGTAISGRLPDTVDDSSAETGHAVARILSDCDSVAVPAWTPEMRLRWQHWKDHLFYALAGSVAPDSDAGGGGERRICQRWPDHPGCVNPTQGGNPHGGPPGNSGGGPGGSCDNPGHPHGGPPGQCSGTPPPDCVDCLTVNGGGEYVVVVVFSGPRLAALDQVRDAPPIDADTRDRIENYLEGDNAGAIPAAGGVLNFESQPAAAAFNDRLFCIDNLLNVTEC